MSVWLDRVHHTNCGLPLAESMFPITAGALLSMAGLAPELAAALVGYGIVLSMATLPLWHWALSS